jgi:predicted negative regulator of RcsB-dependent stress response
MSLEENNNNSQKKIINFFKLNIKSIIIVFAIIFLALFGFLFYKNAQEKINITISEKYTTASILHRQDKKDEAKNLLENIIQTKHKFYSPLALYFMIDNDLETNNEKIINYFDQVIKIKSIEKENLNLIKIKKAIFLLNLDEENKVIETLNPIINSKSVWREMAIKLISDYFISKNQEIKANEYLNLLNSN